MEREKFSRFAREHAGRAKTEQEKLLWEIAIEARYGGTVIPFSLKNPYLMRVYLCPERTSSHEGSREYLHFFFRGDGDRDYHNHPWRRGRSIVLTHGYLDHRLIRGDGPNARSAGIVTKAYRPGDINILEREDYHRVDLLEPELGCWTFFVSTDRLHSSDGTDWDFINPETLEKTPWGKYVGKDK